MTAPAAEILHQEARDTLAGILDADQPGPHSGITLRQVIEALPIGQRYPGRAVEFGLTLAQGPDKCVYQRLDLPAALGIFEALEAWHQGASMKEIGRIMRPWQPVAKGRARAILTRWQHRLDIAAPGIDQLD